MLSTISGMKNKLKLSLASLALLTACGGGNSKIGENTGSSVSFTTASTGTKENLSSQARPFASALRASNLSVPQITLDQLFDWAELTFPELFPSKRETQQFEQYTYRYYPETDVHVGVAGNEIFLLGTTQTQGKIVKVGVVDDYVTQVLSSSSSQTIENGYFSSQPVASISVSDANACWTQFVTPIDMDGDGKKDFAIHFWCAQWNMPFGFNGPTPNTFKVFLNKGTHYSNGNSQLFGVDEVSLGGATRKVVVADFNNDGRMDLAYAVNREDGRPIGDSISLAAAQATVVTSKSNNMYGIDRLGPANWYHAVDVYQTGPNTKSVVLHGFHNTNAKSFSNLNGNWVSDSEPLPFLNGLTYRFMKSLPSKVNDDLIVTVGQTGATALDIYSKTNSGWQKGVGYSPPVTTNSVPVIAWNGDPFMGNRIDIGTDSYTGAGFDDSCLIKRSPTSRAMFIGKFSGRKLPQGYSGQTVNETDMPIVYDLMAFDVVSGNLQKVDLGLDTPLGSEFFNFIECTDVNGDGYDDLVISIQSNSGIPVVYLNDKSNKFLKVSQNVFANIPSAGNVARSILADMDGDGINDLVVFTLHNEPQIIRVYKGLKKL